MATDRDPGRAQPGAAAELAGRGELEDRPEPRGMLVLRLGPARFGLWTDEVLEILRPPPFSRLPLPAPDVVGVTGVRGEVVPVLDLGVRLLGEPADRPGRLILVRHEETRTIIGLLVDAVETLEPVIEADVEPPPAGPEGRLAAEYVAGVVTIDGHVVTLLDPGPVTAPPVPTRDES